MRFEPRRSYTFVFGSPWLGNIQSATLMWTYSSSVFNPLTWRFLSIPALHINRIIVLNLESNNRLIQTQIIYSFCNFITQLFYIAVQQFAELTLQWLPKKSGTCIQIRLAGINNLIPYSTESRRQELRRDRITSRAGASSGLGRLPLAVTFCVVKVVEEVHRHFVGQDEWETQIILIIIFLSSNVANTVEINI